VCRLRNAFFFCCLFFRFFPCFLLSGRTIFFFEVEGKIRSFLSFLCREEEFITLKEEDKEDKEDKELKKRRAELFCSRSVSRSISSSLSAGAKRERERVVFFFQRGVLLRDKNSSGFHSSLSSSSSWRLLLRRRRLRRHFSRAKAQEEEKEALFLGKASKLALLRRRRRRRNNKSGKRGLGWLFGRRLKKVLFCAKEEKTHRQRY
jgi:hypothetical protein